MPRSMVAIQSETPPATPGYDYAGQRTSSWLVSNNSGTEGRIYWDGAEIAYRSNDGTTYFDHKDWIGTERMRTNSTGAIASSYVSLPWGDGYTATVLQSGGDQDSLHFGQLDHDAESSTEHAQFRQYSSIQGRWMSPDPYGGSYDMTNPQSMNRYAYVLNSPLSGVDPSGLDCEAESDECGASTPGIGNDGGQCYDGSVSTCYLSVSDCTPPACTAFNPSTLGTVTQQVPSTVSTVKGSAPNKPVVLKNPCPYQGSALPPSAYAAQGQAANGNPINFALDATMGFPAGHYLDPQPLGSGNAFQNQAYGNYTFGVYMASAGVSLSTALSGANAYAFFRSSYPSWIQRDSNYGSLPAANVANIINGYNAQMNGTTCHN